MYFANILDSCSVDKIIHFLLDISAKPLRIIYILAALFLIHPVIANEKKIETIDLESVKENWVDELITLNICSVVLKASNEATTNQIAIAMDVIIMERINHLGENS